MRIKSFIYSKLCLYQIKPRQNELFLTFDDGPEPGITEFVLSLLDSYNAKATFFCCGYNIEKNRELFNLIKTKGHTVASHTMNHLKGETTPLFKYLSDIRKFRSSYKTNILRPPYGSLTRIEKILLPILGYKVVLWSIDSTDWFEDVAPNDYYFEKIFSDVKAGDIVLFHFCRKHEARTRLILPEFLERFSQKGYTFSVIK